MNQRHQSVLEQMLALPTAPFVEQHVIAYVERFCARREALTCKADRHGNLRVSYRRGRLARSQPIALAAHLDHPGFVAERMIEPKRLRAAWRGGVKPEYFPGQRVRFFAGGEWTRGRIEAVHLAKSRATRWGPRVESVDLAVPRAVPRGALGMWDLPDPRVRGRRIHARACDDIAGAAAMLCALDVVCRKRTTGQLDCLFTRAEEVGFIGAIAACRSRTLPRKTRIVAIECSSELPGATIGDGPILRVGDLTSVFTPSLTAHCRTVAEALRQRDPSFQYQRKLMDGGTCESAVYCEYGYEATGLCLALGNYHNMDRTAKRIAPECIDLRDFEMMVHWFVALATYREPRAGQATALRRDIDARFDRRAQPLD